MARATTAPSKSNGKQMPPAKPVATKPATSKAMTILKERNTAMTVHDEFEDSAGVGFENVTAQDVVIPRITILQALSPQLKKKDPQYIEGAEVGHFCDVATGDLFEESLELIPVYFARVYLEWAPRSTGKGLVRHHGTDPSILAQCSPDDKGRNVLPNGNYIAETATFYCLNATAGFRRCFVPLSSTQLKAARRWMTQLTAEKLTRRDGSQFTPPIFFRAWKATATDESNNEGDWKGWRFEPSTPIMELDPTKGLLEAAKEFHEQCKNGAVTGDMRGVNSYDDGVVVNGEAREEM